MPTVRVHDSILPGYEPVRFLGRGGFGEVWEVVGPDGVSKAVKLCPLSDRVSLAREWAGLVAMQRVRHRGLIHIDYFDICNRRLVVVMELAGRSLVDRLHACLEAGLPGIPRDELLGYLRQAAEALDYLADVFGLQHLDVKPENLFLVDGRLKIADFGLVHRIASQIAHDARAVSPAYAPPELFDGYVEASADQYSLAVTYQEMLTGSRPYPAKNLRGLMLQHLHGRPDLSPLPASDVAVVARALARQPRRRFPSCRAFVDALAAAGVAMPEAARVVASLHGRPSPTATPRRLAPKLSTAATLPSLEPQRVHQRTQPTEAMSDAVCTTRPTPARTQPLSVYGHALTYEDGFYVNLRPGRLQAQVARFAAATGGKVVTLGPRSARLEWPMLSQRRRRRCRLQMLVRLHALPRSTGESYLEARLMRVNRRRLHTGHRGIARTLFANLRACVLPEPYVVADLRLA